MEIEEVTWDTRVEAWLVGETETHYVHILPMIFNHRVVITPKDCLQVYDAGWCYPSYPEALFAVLKWDPNTEEDPPGFLKKV